MISGRHLRCSEVRLGCHDYIIKMFLHVVLHNTSFPCVYNKHVYTNGFLKSDISVLNLCVFKAFSFNYECAIFSQNPFVACLIFYVTLSSFVIFLFTPDSQSLNKKVLQNAILAQLSLYMSSIIRNMPQEQVDTILKGVGL